MYSISDILNALRQPLPQWKRLKGIKIEQHNADIDYHIGNSSVVVKVIYHEQQMMLKCYTRQRQHLEQIYGANYFPGELTAIDILGRKISIDCVLLEWIEGEILDSALCKPLCDVGAIADAFEKLSTDIIAQEYAHGDIKPDNLVVTPTGDLRLIDWDTSFIPQMTGELSPELGTAAYQHPLRTRLHYDRNMDDYSIAYLITMLRAAEADNSILQTYRRFHNFEPTPAEIIQTNGQCIEHIIDDFARRGRAKEYHLAKMLSNPTPTLPLLADVLTKQTPSDQHPTLEQANGLWGLRHSNGWAIAPLFDWIIMAHAGSFAAALGPYIHIMDMSGKVVWTTNKPCKIKPTRDGKYCITWVNGQKRELDIYELLQAKRK